MPSQSSRRSRSCHILALARMSYAHKKRFVAQAKKLGNGVIFTISDGTLKGGGTLFQTVAYVFKGKVIAYE